MLLHIWSYLEVQKFRHLTDTMNEWINEHINIVILSLVWGYLRTYTTWLRRCGKYYLLILSIVLTLLSAPLSQTFLRPCCQQYCNLKCTNERSGTLTFCLLNLTPAVEERHSVPVDIPLACSRGLRPQLLPDRGLTSSSLSSRSWYWQVWRPLQSQP